MQVGQQWAYRTDDRTTRLQQVEIVEVIPRPVRDRYVVRFDDGRQREIAQARLACPWAEADAFRERIEMEARVKHAPPGDWRTQDAVRRVFTLIPESVASCDRGPVTIRDEAALEELVGLRAADLYEEFGCLPEEGAMLSSPLAARAIAMAVCRQYPAAALSTVSMVRHDAEDRDFRGRPYGSYSDAAARDRVRGWCGLEAVESFEARGVVETELARLGHLVCVLGEALERLDPSARHALARFVGRSGWSLLDA